MNVLEVQGLTKRYPAFTLNGVSFDVPQGAVMGFIGRNGAGKSIVPPILSTRLLVMDIPRPVPPYTERAPAFSCVSFFVQCSRRI